MRNIESWVPSKYEYRRGKLRITKDTSIVHVGSRLCGDLLAESLGRNIPKFVKGRLVDLGCGTVPLYVVYRDYVDSVTCVDWSASGSDSHNDFCCDLSKPLPFEDSSFDTIILSDVLEHVPEPVVLWSEMSRILSDQGVLILSTPFIYCLHEQPHDYFRFTEHSLRRLAGQFGFHIEKIEAVGGSPEIITDILGKHIQFIPIVGKFFAALLSGLSYWLRRVPFFRKISEKTAYAFPLEYTMVAKRVRGG